MDKDNIPESFWDDPNHDLLCSLTDGPRPQRNPEQYIFEDRILYMLNALGELRPSRHTARIIHQIVLEQMIEVMDELQKIIVKIQGYPRVPVFSVTHKEILWLMKSNKVKLKRLLKYVKVLDMRHSFKVWKDPDVGDNTDPKALVDKSNKNLNMCLEELKSMEFHRELRILLEDDSVVDEALQNRIERRALATNHMTKKEYLKYSNRIYQANFFPEKDKIKFRNWLLKHTYELYEFSNFALYLLEFLARETVAELVDMAFYLRVVRRKSKAVPDQFPESYAHIHVKDIRISEEHEESKMFLEGPIQPDEIRKAYNKFQITPRNASQALFKNARHKRKEMTLLCLANPMYYRINYTDEASSSSVNE